MIIDASLPFTHVCCVCKVYIYVLCVPTPPRFSFKGRELYPHTIANETFNNESTLFYIRGCIKGEREMDETKENDIYIYKKNCKGQIRDDYVNRWFKLNPAGSAMRILKGNFNKIKYTFWDAPCDFL